EATHERDDGRRVEAAGKTRAHTNVAAEAELDGVLEELGEALSRDGAVVSSVPVTKRERDVPVFPGSYRGDLGARAIEPNDHRVCRKQLLHAAEERALGGVQRRRAV